ncbi:glycosyl hydrolase [Bacteroidota bacterium]
MVKAVKPEHFKNPPSSFSPWVNWLWIDGHVTPEGIKADLEAMQGVGIGGFSIMSVGPQSVSDQCMEEGPVKFMSEEFMELFQYTLQLAGELGLEVAMSVCDGYTHAGGPLITPEMGMQQLTWSKTNVRGPITYSSRLEQPPTNLGFYQDVAVIAFPAPIEETDNMSSQISSIRTNTSAENLEKLMDHDLNTYVSLEKPANDPVVVQLDFEEEFPCRAVSIAMPERNIFKRNIFNRADRAELQVSADGETFYTVVSWNLFWRRQHHPPLESATETNSITVRLEEVRSPHYRIVLHTRQRVDLGEIELIPTERLHYWEAKAGFADVWGHDGGAHYYDSILLRSSPSPSSNRQIDHKDSHKSNPQINKDQVVDLTALLKPDGTLNWEAPPGNWTLLRIGHTPTGQEVGSPTNTGNGLECDKLDPAGIERQFQHVILPLLQKTGDQENSPFVYAHIDSWEASCQNWTPNLRTEFIQRRGYDPLPYFPVITGGNVINSLMESERFLWDYRRTIADLIEDNCYGRFRELCHEQGIQMHAQPSGAQQFLCDPIGFHSQADISMGEFWISDARPRIDCKYASSVANIYGRKIVSGEAFTGTRLGPWQEDPGSLKRFGDAAFCMGINNYEIQTYAHQPWLDREPGMACHRWGIRYDRTNTWFEQSRAWIKYLSRCQYLLRQGQYVADICCLTAEGAPTKVGYRNEYNPAIPNGYDYDACNADVIENLMYVEKGLIRVPSGMDYRILLLPDRSTITPSLLKKIEKLVHDGAVVVGPKPSASPSLTNYPQCDVSVKEIADKVWGPCDGVTVKENHYGKGMVIWGKSFEEIFASLDIDPDFDYGRQSGEKLAYVHRKTRETDIYFVVNRSDNEIETDAMFRAEKKVPQFWNPVNGEIHDVCSWEVMADGRIKISISLSAYESVFVMFRESPIDQSSQNGQNRVATAEEVTLTEVINLEGDWYLNFPDSDGKNISLTIDDLLSWTESTNPEIRYFSGTAKYTRSFNLPVEYKDSLWNLILDLGEIKNLAEVTLNGHDLGVLWTPPFACNISEYVQDGKNNLEIRITNLWPNRLIGDMHLPEGMRHSYATTHPYKADSPLLPSGLFGPVRIRPENRYYQEYKGPNNF